MQLLMHESVTRNCNNSKTLCFARILNASLRFLRERFPAR